MDTKQQLDAVQRYKVGYHSDEQGVRGSTPTCIPAHDGAWVRFADMQALQVGHEAARLEIESLQTRIQELGQQARECSDRKVVQLESALARHVRSGKDWAMRAEALERTITTLRAQIASHDAKLTAAEKAMRELEGQVDAVGAGGVEPLRKRECLHQISEPDKAGEQNHFPLAITSAPERIWLDLGFNPCEEDAHFSNLHDLTWSQDNATGDGIEYVRSDLAARGAAQASPVDAELMRDAQRYRWLRNEETDWYVGPSYSTYNDNVCDGEYRNFFGVELDKAIDAARAAQGGV